MNMGMGFMQTQTPTSAPAPAQVAAPAISPNEGDYTTQQSVTMTCATSGATIRYTTDGTVPNETSPVYSGAITQPVCACVDYRAMAFKSGMTDSDVTSKYIRIATPESYFSFALSELEGFLPDAITDIIIPSTWGYVRGAESATAVTSIKADTFTGYSITSVIIPSSITTIGDGAFNSCELLATVTLNDGLTDIGPTAFAACLVLTTIAIPNSVTTIGASAFQSCSGLLSAVIGTGITSWGASMFADCPLLIIVTWNSATVPDSAFKTNTTIVRIILGSGVTAIGEDAFKNNPIADVTIPASVTIFNSADTMGTNAGFRAYYLGISQAAGRYYWTGAAWSGAT